MSLVSSLAFFFLMVSSISLSAATTIPSKSCKQNEFWYEAKSCCLPHGGPPSPPQPPKGQQCPPTGYYWGDRQGCCVPSHPPPQNNPPPQCRNGWTWYPYLHMCLPGPTPPTPPPSHPSGVYHGHGHINQGHDDHSEGHDDHSEGHGDHSEGHNDHGEGHNDHSEGHDDHSEGHDNHNQGHAGHISGHGIHNYSQGRSWSRRGLEKSRSMPLCPEGLDACPVSGLTPGDYECVDTATELEACGGCPSLGQGQDCTAIPGVWNVGCERGSCAVYSCAMGFRRSRDGKSCIPL